VFRSAWAFDAFFTVPRCICKTFEWFVDLLVQFVHYRCHFRDPGKLSALRKWSGRSSIGNLTGDTVKFLLSERWWLLCNKLRTNFLFINLYNFQSLFCEIYRGIKCLWRPNDFSVHRLPFEYRFWISTGSSRSSISASLGQVVCRGVYRRLCLESSNCPGGACSFGLYLLISRRCRAGASRVHARNRRQREINGKVIFVLSLHGNLSSSRLFIFSGLLKCVCRPFNQFFVT